MPADITKWLEGLGLGQYSDAFKENDLDWSTLPELNHDLLKEAGIKSIGHRVAILKAIEGLDSKTNSAPVPRVESDTVESSDFTRTGEAERRQLTVMFCDLVGSTELSQRLDPEDLREVNRAYQDACKDAIERYDGYIARYMGDGVLAYFGYPQAHEDDAERAIHAGLGVIESVDTLSPDTHEIKLGVRVGIATGPVVVGDLIGEGASQESAVVGETPNLAARLQGLAATNTVVISPGTHDLAGERFEYDHLGPHSLKGIAKPVNVWRAIASTSAESRFEAAHRGGLTPLVGREHEIGLLLERWEQAKEGDGQVVLLSGEAGIGKSRITEALRERTAGDDPIRLRYQCSPFYTNTALHPVIEQLQRAAHIEADDANEVKLDKLESFLGGDSVAPDDVVPLFAPLLSVSTEGRYPPLEMTPERQKMRTLEALVVQMEGLSREHPVLLIFEDIHWADPTSLELLELTIERTQSIPVLVVLTYRPEFSSPWSGYTHITTLTLNRFTRSLAASMVGNVAGGKMLPNGVLEQIIAKTDGVPLFVEELTKTIIESGGLTEESERYVLSGPLSGITIPATLHDSLMARLDRLGAVKEVAQSASVIGREFDHGLLEAILSPDIAELDAAVIVLLGSGLILRASRAAGQRYVFKHALVQNAAYESLLKSKRQSLHKSIAEALASTAGIEEAQPELLAHHYTEANLPEIAFHYWIQAGKRAIESSANPEAVGHFSSALSTLSEMPGTAERERLELNVQLALISCLTATKGYGSDEVKSTSARARELCERLGETQMLEGVLRAEAVTSIGAGDYQMFMNVAAEVVSLGEQHNNSLCLLLGLEFMGWGELGLGAYRMSQVHIDRALVLYDESLHAVHGTHLVTDQKVASLTVQAFTKWLLGFPDESLRSAEQAIAYARALNHASTLAWALPWAGAHAAALRRDLAATERYAAEVMALPNEQRNPVDRAWGQVLAGWAIGKRGELDAGISMLCEGLSFLRSTYPVHLPAQLGYLAELFIESGQCAKALELLEEAHQRLSKSGERIWESENLRLQAEAISRENPGSYDQAQSLLLEAIEVARLQEAKSLELRSSVALGKLWQQHDKRQEAQDLISPIYDWFTEGFDTPDLREAKALLEELS